VIALHPWSDKDLPVLEKTLGNAEVMQHLGGIEDPRAILARHRSYLALALPEGRMFTISVAAEPAIVGTIGFWETTWHGEAIYETGWMVLPAYTGRGIATQAALCLIQQVRSLRRHRFLHAFPAVDNVASNRVCRKAGFVNQGKCEVEFPKGHFMRSNDWRIDLLHPEPSSPTAGASELGLVEP